MGGEPKVPHTTISPHFWNSSRTSGSEAWLKPKTVTHTSSVVMAGVTGSTCGVVARLKGRGAAARVVMGGGAASSAGWVGG